MLVKDYVMSGMRTKPSNYVSDSDILLTSREPISTNVLKEFATIALYK